MWLGEAVSRCLALAPHQQHACTTAVPEPCTDLPSAQPTVTATFLIPRKCSLWPALTWQHPVKGVLGTPVLAQ